MTTTGAAIVEASILLADGTQLIAGEWVPAVKGASEEGMGRWAGGGGRRSTSSTPRRKSCCSACPGAARRMWMRPCGRRRMLSPGGGTAAR